MTGGMGENYAKVSNIVCPGKGPSSHLLGALGDTWNRIPEGIVSDWKVEDLLGMQMFTLC